MNPNYLISNLVFSLFRGKKRKIIFLIGVLTGIILSSKMPKKILKEINNKTTEIVEYIKNKF